MCAEGVKAPALQNVTLRKKKCVFFNFHLLMRLHLLLVKHLTQAGWTKANGFFFKKNKYIYI